MSKAFNTIDHNLLLIKLKDVGASPSMINWFQSYLTSRYQVVRIGTDVSDPLQMASGMPQGSILGPLLFNIYVNDLPSMSQHCSPHCYEDDTKLPLSFRLHDQETAISQKNQDLTKIRNWCFDNQLLLNPGKTKLLVCGSRKMALKVKDFGKSSCTCEMRQRPWRDSGHQFNF